MALPIELSREERIDHRSNSARGFDEIPTIHEGVAAHAMELKAEIKKLTALVARTVPAIAEGLEKLRSRVLIFCYQLSHIRSGKSHIQKSLAVWKPSLGMLLNAKQETSRLLNEDKEEWQMRQLIIRHQKTTRNTAKRRIDIER